MPEWLLALFARYGYGAVFVGVMLEGAGLPVPGETMLLGGAVMAHLGRLSLPVVMGVAMAAGIAGDNVGFLIGRAGGRALIARYGSRVGLTRARLTQFDRFFERHGPVTIFFARFVTGLRVVCAVLAGASGIRWRTFAAFNAAGVIVWSIAIGSVGYLLGESWDLLERWIGRSGLVALLVVLVAAIIVVKRAKMTK